MIYNIFNIVIKKSNIKKRKINFENNGKDFNFEKR